MNETPLVSIVIVNYNAGQQLATCLRDLAAQTFTNWELIIVDNASHDGSLAAAEGLPGVLLVRNPDNRGFAAGQNQGIAASHGEYVLALNYDVMLPEGFLAAFMDGMERHPEAGWACCKLLQLASDGQPQGQLYAAGHVLPANRFALLRGAGEEDTGQYDREEYVFGAPGAAALYRRALIEDISLGEQFFDEALFTWYEDVDVDWRANLRGHRCVYIPSAVAYHAGHVGEDYAEPFRSFRAQMTIRNRWLVVAACETRPSWLRALSACLAYEASLLLYVIRVGLIRPYLRAMAEFAGMLGYVRRKRSLMHGGRP
ncbi:MAG: glycosyltransferase family 2 protein [Anaerolineae bacterium]